MKILIFGAGNNGAVLASYIEKSNQSSIIGFVDNNVVGEYCKYRVYKINEIGNLNYDKIIISVGKRKFINEIYDQLKNEGVEEDKISCLVLDRELMTACFSSINRYDEKIDPRVSWVRYFSEYASEEIKEGSVAECGVNRGEFAEYLNKYFSNRKLYLFDTFEGFSEQDLQIERDINDGNFMKGGFNDVSRFECTNEEIVRSRMPHLEKCEIHKGYFPESAKEVNDVFCFVNLDMDLYKPMLDGLEFFVPRMVKGGVILMHDYFHPELPGVKKAVCDYENVHNIRLKKMPIADGCSIAIVK